MHALKAAIKGRATRDANMLMLMKRRDKGYAGSDNSPSVIQGKSAKVPAPKYC
jgi:hypothetical protein